MKAYIYTIKNKVNNKCYVGSTKHPRQRKSDHFSYLKKGKHHSPYLQNSYNKYGKSSFEFSIIEECDLSTRKERELHYIIIYKAFERDFGYNVYEPNESNFKCSEKTKEKIRDNHIITGWSTPIDVYLISDLSFTATFDSISTCAKVLNLHRSAIHRILSGKAKSYKGYTFVHKGFSLNYKASPKQRFR